MFQWHLVSCRPVGQEWACNETCCGLFPLLRNPAASHLFLSMCLAPVATWTAALLHDKGHRYGTQACQWCICNYFEMFFFAVNLFTNLKTFFNVKTHLLSPLCRNCRAVVLDLTEQSSWAKGQVKQILSPQVRVICMEKSNYNETLLLYPLVILNKGSEKVTYCSGVHWSGAFVTLSTVCWRDKCR